MESLSSLAPYFVQGFAGGVEPGVMPMPVDEFAVKLQGGAHPAAIARKELDVFGVLAVFKREVSTARTEEFPGLDVDGYPLETASRQDLIRPAVARCMVAGYFGVGTASRHVPHACQGIVVAI